MQPMQLPERSRAAGPARTRRCVGREKGSNMDTNKRNWLRRAVIIWVLALTATVAPARAAESPNGNSRTMKVDGITLHYLTAGSGKPLIFIHGYAQSAHMWSTIIHGSRSDFR